MHMIFLRLCRFFTWWVFIGVTQCHQDVQNKICRIQHCQCPIVVIQSTFIQYVLKPTWYPSTPTDLSHNINWKNTTHSSCSNHIVAEKLQVALHWGRSLISEESINAVLRDSFDGTKKEKLWKKPKHAHWDFLIIVIRIVKLMPFNHV